MIVEMFLIYHVTSRKHMFNGLREFMGGSFSWSVNTLACLVVIGLVQEDV